MPSKTNRKTKIQTQKKKDSVKTPGMFLEIFLLALIISLFIWSLMEVYHIQDDAFITFRYIKNFVNGNGLVFNIGERVEGYTNFLWAVILSLPYILNFDLVTIAPLLSSFFGILILIVTYLISRLLITVDSENKEEKFIRGLFTTVPVLLLTSTGAFAYWTVSGMETTFFIFLVLLALYFYIRNKEIGNINYYTPALLALSALTRPEGIYFFVIIYLHKLLFTLKNNKRDNPVSIIKKVVTKNNLIELSIFLVPVLLHLIFRLIYYGYPFPNTFYAKANFTYSTLLTGIQYLVSFLKDYLLYGIILIAPLFLLRKRMFSFEISLMCLLIFLYSLYVIAIGGDVLALHRFWLPVLPLIFILFSKALLELFYIFRNKWQPSSQWILAAFILLLLDIVYYNYTTHEEDIAKLKQKEINLVGQLKDRAGIINELQNRQNKKLTVAVSTIGAFSYYADVIIIDMLGLTDEFIAHSPETIPEISNDPGNPWKEKKYNSDYVLRRKPDYIIFATTVKPSSFAERALFTKKDFFYNYFVQFIPAGSDLRYFFFARKNQTQINISGSKILTEQIKPGFVKNYVKLSEDLSSYIVDENPVKSNKINQAFEKTKETYPSFFSDQYRILGDAAFTSGDIDLAVKYYEKSVSVDSLNVISYLGLCSSYQRLQKPEIVNYYIEKMQEYQIADDRLIR